MTDVVEVRRGAYHDSVSLMQVSRAVADADRVDAALVAMATELNLELLAGMGFTLPDAAGPGDLVVAIRTPDEDAAAAARAVLEQSLAGLTSSASGGTDAPGAPPRTIRTAAADSTVALVSVPGRAAFVEAMDALEAGLDVMVFSDNVPVEQEVRLKDEATRRELLVMGPDCGTAIVAGVGLGFANAVRPGPVGVVAASGTGAQQLTCLLDAADVGVSHVLGVGGRDLTTAVAGRSTLQAMALLDADPGTELIVVLSKPPAADVAERVRAAADAMRTPVLLGLLGAGRDDLAAVAARVVAAVGAAAEPAWPQWPARARQQPRAGRLVGLYCGGTLCDEAMIVAADALGPIASNIPLQTARRLDRAQTRSGVPPGPGHAMLDLGDDELTSGRPHPMIDPAPRDERLRAAGADSATGVVLLDVLLGHGAHPDPATGLAAAIRDARAAAAGDGRDLAVVVCLCGTRDDPQGLPRQAEALVDAGAHVFAANAAAARHAVGLVHGPPVGPVGPVGPVDR